MSSDITITGLTCSGGPNQINLLWTVSDPHVDDLSYLRYDHAEVRRSASSDMSMPTTLTTNAITSFVDTPILPGASYYYQARAVNKSGLFGEWYAAVQGTEAQVDSAAIASAWTLDSGAYIDAASGTFGTHTVALYYKLSGLTVFFTAEVVVTAVGTATLSINLHFDALADLGYEVAQHVSPTGYYTDDGTTLVAASAAMFASAAPAVAIMKYDGTSPLANNRTFVVSGQFEVSP